MISVLELLESNLPSRSKTRKRNGSRGPGPPGRDDRGVLCLCMCMCMCMCLCVRTERSKSPSRNHAHAHAHAHHRRPPAPIAASPSACVRVRPLPHLLLPARSTSRNRRACRLSRSLLRLIPHRQEPRTRSQPFTLFARARTAVACGWRRRAVSWCRCGPRDGV